MFSGNSTSPKTIRDVGIPSLAHIINQFIKQLRNINMGISTRSRHNHGFEATLLIIVMIATIIRPNESTTIPAEKGKIESWFNENVKPASNRKGTLDPVLAEAEVEPTIIKVKKDGSGDFKTINEAIKSIPAGNKKRVIVWIGSGDYSEKVCIDRNKPFITLFGEPGKTPRIMFDDTAAETGTFESATLIALPDYFMAVNLIIIVSNVLHTRYYI